MGATDSQQTDPGMSGLRWGREQRWSGGVKVFHSFRCGAQDSEETNLVKSYCCFILSKKHHFGSTSCHGGGGVVRPGGEKSLLPGNWRQSSLGGRKAPAFLNPFLSTNVTY